MIGADPELFFHNGTNFVSAIDRVGGTKTDPKRLLGGFCLQEDNVAVEYNIPPCDTPEKFVWANKLMLEEIGWIAEKQGLKSVIASSAVFPDKELADPRAQEFGCDPDFDAWELEPNAKPACDNKSLRSAGGHIHVAMQGAKTEQKIAMIRVLDLIVGVPLAFLDPESKRRELYGRAGACRFKPYGVEYRTPSNVWLAKEDLTYRVGYIVTQLLKKKDAYKELQEVTMGKEDVIKSAINTLDHNAYANLLPIIRQWWGKGDLAPCNAKIVDLDDAIKLVIEE